LAASTISLPETWRGGLAALLLAVGLLGAPAVRAAPASFEAEVVHVTDGDTVIVRRARGGGELTVRIEGMDAPEICQAGGPASRSALAGLVLHRRVEVAPRGRDTYRRTLARLRLGGQDVGGWMVAQGQAWSYRFRGRQGPYHEAEVRARWEQRGLWAQPHAEEPRRFRQRHGSCHPGSIAR